MKLEKQVVLLDGLGGFNFFEGLVFKVIKICAILALLFGKMIKILIICELTKYVHTFKNFINSHFYYKKESKSYTSAIKRFNYTFFHCKKNQNFISDSNSTMMYLLTQILTTKCVGLKLYFHSILLSN